ncbi:sugar phosphate isomerase/epimerase family protein [Streptomyces sp. NPDC001698]|uniref:sugar phosphate isomerase/epimerase family protein n=1 Tax=Streptomyces sp. NPDC001698 TaxID=3364601 RepID=UPI00369D1214
MNRRQALKAAMGAALAAPIALNSLDQAYAAAPAAPAAQPSRTSRRYNASAYPVSMSLYCFNQNINSWIKGRSGKSAPPITTADAITWAKNLGCDQVDITAYFIPGYDTHTMPTRPTSEIVSFAAGLRDHCDNLGIGVSGTGVFNDFADPDASRRELDVQRTKFWTDIAAVLGAPGIRVFSGVVPEDIGTAGGWEGVTRSRIVPALREVTAYAAGKGVEVTLQNGRHESVHHGRHRLLPPLRGTDRRGLRLVPGHHEGGAALNEHPGEAQARRRRQRRANDGLPAPVHRSAAVGLPRLHAV